MRDSALESSYVYKVSKYERFKSVFNHIIKFLGNFLFMFVVVIILVMLIYSVYTKKNGNSGYVPIVSAYVIVSPSMVPTINVYDAVVAYRPNVDSLKKGDIITFNSTDARYAGRTVTHRILGISELDGQVVFRTKGDNNTTLDDAHVLGSNIYGKVFFVIPWLGYLQILLARPIGWILLVVFPCVGIILYDIIKLSKTIKRSKVATNVAFKNVEITEVDDEVYEEATENVEEDSSIEASDIHVVEENSSDRKDVAIEDKNIDSSVESENVDIQKIVQKEESSDAFEVHEENETFSSRFDIIIVSQFSRERECVDSKVFVEVPNDIEDAFKVVIACQFPRISQSGTKCDKHNEDVDEEKKDKEEEKEIDYIEIL